MSTGSDAVITLQGLAGLIEVLQAQGRQVAGPTVAGGSLRYAEITGVDQLPQGWSEEAVQRTAPMAMLLYTAIVHWYASEGRLHDRLSILPWYTRKSHASFADMLATLKRLSLRQRISALGLSGQGSRKTQDLLENLVNLAA